MISNKNKNISKKSMTVCLLIVSIAGFGPLGSATGSTIMNNNNQAEAQEKQVNSPIRVKAGGGNSTDIKTVFVPQNIEIQAGQTINWFNPTPVGEPHSVTFFKDTKLFPVFAVPFAVPASTEFDALMPSPNLEPLTVPSNDTTSKTVVITNARSLSPVVVDSTGQNVTYLPINANYTMDGSESYVNSGWVWPEGKNPPEAPPISEFTVTFGNPGTYGYVCTIHPWMTGTVVVS
jgi:plastocyanin